MSDYNYLTYSQDQLNRAIKILDDLRYGNNYTHEVKDILEILARTRPIYKKSYGNDELVQVGILTAKNEIIFDKPKEFLYSTNKNLARNSSVYWAGWFVYIDVDKIDETGKYIKSQRLEHLSYFEIVNRHQFQEILYYSGRRDDIDICNSLTLGFMMGDYRNAEVVFYDQYREV